MADEQRIIGVGMPALLYLEQFGSHVWDAFGHPPYLVGSALTGKEWRDVDVRLILPDEEYERLFWPLTIPIERTSGKWVALCMAFSALGRQMTGLPIDFQIQHQMKSNETYKGMPRQALGLIEARIGDPSPKLKRRHSEETKAKMRAARIGTKHDEETKRKISDGMRRRFGSEKVLSCE